MAGGSRGVSLPTEVSAAVMPVRLRTDLPREVATDYWVTRHREIVRRLPQIVEYTQHHFSQTDNGYWPATDMVGTIVPPSWPFDGLAETTLPGVVGSLRIPRHMRPVYFDEQVPFETVIGNMTGPRGGRWWTTGLDETVGHRTVLLVRRRRGVSRRRFKAFVHDQLGPALLAGGARDLRTYTFLPYLGSLHATAGVSHDNPAHRRHHAAVIFGSDTRADVDALVGSAAVRAAIDVQHDYCLGMHAFTVERSVSGIRAGNAGENT